MYFNRYSSLSQFFDQLFAVLSTLRNERDHATLMALVKRRVDIVDPVEIEYAEILTPYALQFVSKQLLLKSHVNFIGEVQSCFLVSSSAGSIKVTNINCECAFWTTIHLPCRHIFAVREKQCLPLFCGDLVAARWTLQHMKEVYSNKVTCVNPESFQVRKL